MVYEKRKLSLDWLALWILLSAWASFTGWLLSALKWLNPGTILAVYALFYLGAAANRSWLQTDEEWKPLRLLRSRFWAPRIWLSLFILALVGGVIYTPNNYDYLTYRFPRVLYWSWDGAWSWVSTVNQRINYSGTGFEWLMVPLFVVLKTDRFFFLVNIISYLLLPGLIFSVFKKLGISPRISWWWMWLFPCGYCFILQAGSVGNDSFAAIYLLAALHFLFRSRGPSATRNLILSCLSIALVTGAKASNLPLVLPWLALLYFQRNHLLGKVRWVPLGVGLVVSAIISFLPVGALNMYYTGDFAGDPTNSGRMKVSNPVSALLGNSFQLVKDNIAPPLSPHTINWTGIVPCAALKERLARDFPRMCLVTKELQIEEEAGIGLGVTLFAIVLAFIAIWSRFFSARWIVARSRVGVWLVAGGVVAWLGYMTKMGSEATSRLIAAYYPLLVAALLVTAALDGCVMRLKMIRCVGLLVMLSTIPLVILSPARPLFPVDFISRIMTYVHVPETIVARYNEVYHVYAVRSDAFREFLAPLPANEKIIGFVQRGNDSEVPLWRPFGSRKVVELTPSDSLASIKARGIRYVAIGQTGLTVRHNISLDKLVAQWSGTIVSEKEIILFAHVGPEAWYLMRL